MDYDLIEKGKPSADAYQHPKIKRAISNIAEEILQKNKKLDEILTFVAEGVVFAVKYHKHKLIQYN